MPVIDRERWLMQIESKMFVIWSSDPVQSSYF
jgi:hypothetical protein